MEELSDVLHNARRFYENTYGILKSVPSKMLFDAKLIECPVEKIIGLLKILDVGREERELFWIAKLYFVLPLPPDWTIVPNSFNTQTFVYQSMVSKFHPSISFILFLLNNYRTSANVTLPFGSYIQSHKNHFHYTINRTFDKSIRNEIKFKNPFKLLKDSAKSDMNIIEVSFFNEYKSFEKRFAHLLKNSSQLEDFVLTMPHLKSVYHFTKANICKHKLDFPIPEVIAQPKKSKEFQIRHKKNNFLEINENRENNFSTAAVSTKRYFTTNSRPRSQKIPAFCDQNIETINYSNALKSIQSAKDSWMTKFNMQTRIEKTMNQLKDEEETNVFTSHDRAYKSNKERMNNFMNTVNVNLKRNEVSNLKDHLSTKKVNIPMKTLWGGLGAVSFGIIENQPHLPIAQIGSKLLLFHK
jgi:hypothetical protein